MAYFSSLLTIVLLSLGLISAEVLSQHDAGRPWRPQNFVTKQSECSRAESGDGRLILTPYIKSGHYKLAQQLSKVDLEGFNGDSYAGFLTVNETDNSNMFFWFFPAETDRPDLEPVILWLQGGPGASSMFGLFVEHGPLRITKLSFAQLREYRWSKMANMLYIDNPVGTGFSYTGSIDGYSRNQKQVSQNLYEAVLQFYTLFPQFQSGRFYITGESYAGKYVPSLAYRIHVSNMNATLEIPLFGIAIGNGLVDPGTMMEYGDMLYQMGMVDESERNVFHQKEDAFRAAVAQRRWRDAFHIFDELINGDKIPYPAYFYNVTHSQYYFNILRTKAPEEFGYYNDYLDQCHVREAINVGTQEFSNGSLVEDFMLDDIPQSVATKLETLMENYRVLIYNGQLDIICGLPLTEAYLYKLNWSGAAAYKKAPKTVWKVDESDDEVAGYVRQVGQFYQVAVRAGRWNRLEGTEALIKMAPFYHGTSE